MNWDSLLATRMSGMTASEIRELLKLIDSSSIISFAGGIPSPDFFPFEAIQRAYRDIFNCNNLSVSALQYTVSEGYLPLRKWIGKRIGVSPDELLITSGSQQVLDFLGKIFINKNDLVLVSAPTYLGALQAFSSYEPTYLTIPMDNDGILIEELESVLVNRPKFLYLVPDFQNPNGITLSLDRRIKTIELCRSYGVPIVEDCAYSELRYDGKQIPTLFDLDVQGRQDGNGVVLQAGTFSKTIVPALRVGWVAGPPALVQKLTIVKQAADIHTSTINQIVMYQLVNEIFDEHVIVLRNAYRIRRDAMLEALCDYFPSCVRWSKPQGGMFIWLELPSNIDGSKLLDLAIREQRIAFVPGSSFFPDHSNANTCRLSFSVNTPDQIRDGIRRLSLLVKKLIKQST